VRTQKNLGFNLGLEFSPWDGAPALPGYGCACLLPSSLR